MKNQILLVDESLSLDDVNFKYQKIISLDFISHEKLQSKKIDHIKSDSFISDSELKDLQKQSIDFSYWFENSDIRHCIMYRNMNLGKLFYVDFYTYLLPILKIFFELSKIILKYPNVTFFVSSKISNFLKNFSVKYKEINQINNDPEFYLDKITYDIKLNKKIIHIPISKSSYKFIKKISEHFFKFIFKQKYDHSKKSHILIEFNPIKYQKLFSIFPDTSNFVIYNRRRPYFWNFHSFAIFKKSNASFFSEYELKDNKIKNNHENTSNCNSSAILEVKQHNEFFNNFFKIQGNSFWNIIKQSFFKLCETRFSELIYEIELANKFFEKTNPSTITVWSESGTIEQILINIAKNRNIPVLLLQHGYYLDDKLALDFNNFSGVLPQKSDHFLIWGNKMADYCKDVNLVSKNNKIIGCPFFDDYKNSKTPKSEYILVAAQGPTDFFISDLMTSTYENYIKAIIKICNISKNLNKKLIIKLHPDPHDLDLTKYVEHLNSDIQIIKSGNIKELIQNSEIFISIDISTTILEAQLLEKPVIAISVKDYQLGDSNSKILQSCIYTNIDELENQILKILTNPEFKNKIISNGSKFVNDYLHNSNSSSDSFINFLNNF